VLFGMLTAIDLSIHEVCGSQLDYTERELICGNLMPTTLSSLVSVV
jgi:hypothetical protein